MIYLQLFYEFFKTGLFTIGGGLAAIPLLTEMSEKTGWFTGAQLTDMIAVSESTPGPLAINMATYVGYTTAGLPGGIIASLGMIMPPLIIVLTIARLLSKFRENIIVDSAFYGLRPASVGLISAAGLSVLMLSLVRLSLWEETGKLSSLFDYKAIILAVLLFAFTNIPFVGTPKKKLNIHPIIIIACSAVVGIIFNF